MMPASPWAQTIWGLDGAEDQKASGFLLTCILTQTSNLKATPSAKPYKAYPDSAREEGQRVKMK